MRSVVVIGGGLAGVWAAVTARRGGAQVHLVSRAPGATAMYGGGMQIAPDPGTLLAEHPHHPFTRLYRDPLKLAADLDAATGSLTALMTRIGLPLVVSRTPGARYPDLHGRFRAAQVIPATVAPAEHRSLQGRHVAVAAVPGLGDYDAEAAAQGLAEEGVKVSVATAEVADLAPGAALTDLYGRPAPPVATGADLVAFPPGFVRLPGNGFEMLAGVPSAHGWRLHRALERVIAAEGITQTVAEVTGFRHRGGRLEAVAVEGGEIPGEAFVLAGGKYIGGGLVKTRLVTEPLLDLVVYHGGVPIQEAYARLRHLEYVDPESAFSTGLVTDQQLRPIDAQGRPSFQNLHAAGSILGGYDSVRGGCGFGVPLLTGWLAGGAALQ